MRITSPNTSLETKPVLASASIPASTSGQPGHRPRAVSMVGDTFRAPAAVQTVPLSALAGRGESRFLGPDGSPRLVAISPANPKGPAIVFIHGILSDPLMLEHQIREAQARGMQVYAMAYDTIGKGLAENSVGFASEFQKLNASGVRNLTIVGHSLGGMTTKAALDRMTDEHGNMQAFEHVRFVAEAVPWGGVAIANLARILPAGWLQFARDLASKSPVWRHVVETPFSPKVDFRYAQGDTDELSGNWISTDLVKRQWQTVVGRARQFLEVPRSAHISVLRAPETDAMIFADDAALDAATTVHPAGNKHLFALRHETTETASMIKTIFQRGSLSAGSQTRPG